jgi:predicted kinase
MEAVFLIGFPGAGKSWWRERHVRGASRPTTVVSTDELVAELAAAEGIAYAEAWRRSPKLEGRARAAMRAAVEAGVDVVVDRTNLKAATRGRFLRLVPSGWTRRAVVFATPPEVLRARMAERAAAGGHMVPWGFVLGMMKGYEAPRPGEFDRVTYVGADGRVLGETGG